MSDTKEQDSRFHQLYHDPKPKDFLILGELLKIEVHFNSFTVHFQHVGTDRFEYQLQVCRKTYPIQCLQDFFKKNSKIESKHFAHRPAGFWEEFKP